MKLPNSIHAQRNHNYFFTPFGMTETGYEQSSAQEIVADFSAYLAFVLACATGPGLGCFIYRERLQREPNLTTFQKIEALPYDLLYPWLLLVPVSVAIPTRLYATAVHEPRSSQRVTPMPVEASPTTISIAFEYEITSDTSITISFNKV